VHPPQIHSGIGVEHINSDQAADQRRLSQLRRLEEVMGSANNHSPVRGAKDPMNEARRNGELIIIIIIIIKDKISLCEQSFKDRLHSRPTAELKKIINQMTGETNANKLRSTKFYQCSET